MEVHVMQPLIRVTKEVTFDCAHMLSGYDGLCKNLHGHTYKVQVTVEGCQIEDGPKKGMLIDFADLKTAMVISITKDFDHALILGDPKVRSEAEDALAVWAATHNMHRFVFRDRTTAENMALYFKEKIKHYLYYDLKYYNIRDVYVRLWETPTSFAEV